MKEETKRTGGTIMDKNEQQAYKDKCERKQKVRITFETTIPGYNADGSPLQALAYIAMKIAAFIMSPSDFHNVKLEQIEEYGPEESEKNP